MAAPDEKDDALKAPPGAEPGTTPYGSAEPSGTTTELDLAQPVLRALAERYDLLAEVGRGGMGIVYRARDRETGDVVGLKVLLPEIAARPDLIERFKAELLLARKITHKNVCRVYDLNRFGAVAAISMEYIEGESLRSLLNRVEGLSVRHGLKILRQVIAGLGEAHAQGVVHRDLKPENILIARDGSVKVMDFGIARSVETGITKTGTLIGTPAYMSPEQVEGNPTDAGSDIYSLGLVMYEVFVGQPAFRADTPVAMAMKQLQEVPPPPRSIDPDLPDRLDRAIQKCLAKDPKKRFQSVTELEAALSQERVPAFVAESEPVPASHLSVWGRQDWVLLVLSVVGMLYYLSFRETVFPASKMRLEVDAITARREVESLAAKLERRLPSHYAWMQLELDSRRYVDTVSSQILERRRRAGDDAAAALAQIDLPLRWRVNFSVIEKLWVERLIREFPPDYAFVDRKGRVEGFYSPSTTPVHVRYIAPPIEQRRQLARQVAELVCGPVPADARMVETTGGELGAIYAVTWIPSRPVHSPPWGHVRLYTEKVEEIECQYRSAAPPSGMEEIRGVTRGIVRGMEVVLRLALLFTFGQFLFLFALGQGHRSATLFWRRMPLALILGIASAWLLLHASGLRISLPGALLGALAAAALFLVALVAVEYLLLRWVPSQAATYMLLLRGRVLEPAVGLAIVRGALAGLALAAILVALVHLSLLYIAARGIGPGGALLGVLIDPASLGYAMESFSPGLFVLGGALLSGWAVGFVFMGGFLATSEKDVVKAKNKRAAQVLRLAGLGAALPLVAVSLQLPVQQYFSPGMGHLVSPLLAGLLLGLLLLRYDVLTVIVAIITATLWTLALPLAEIFREVGNTAYWALLAGWAVVVGAGALVAFRRAVVRAIQQRKAELQ